MFRDRQCRCGTWFSYEVGRGKDKKYCRPECRAAFRRQKHLTATSCSVPDCDRRRRAIGSLYCETHYYRLRRTGRIDVSPRKGFYRQKRGYVVQHGMSGHPLATERNPHEVYQHRVVFFAQHGEGPFLCHHCSKTVTWDDMDIDHLDDDRGNNDPSNLVASCPPCNKERGRDKWRAKMEQRRIMLSAFGTTKCLSEWARDVGISSSAMRTRLSKGWSVERAVSQARGPFGPPSRNLKEILS